MPDSASDRLFLMSFQPLNPLISQSLTHSLVCVSSLSFHSYLALSSLSPQILLYPSGGCCSERRSTSSYTQTSCRSVLEGEGDEYSTALD
jgi:hypothetical protein